MLYPGCGFIQLFIASMVMNDRDRTHCKALPAFILTHVRIVNSGIASE